MDINQNIGNLMKEAQKMQERMQQAQAELTDMTITGDAGGGMLKVKINGRHDMKAAKISDTLVPDEGLRTMLEDLICAAVNNAVQKIEKESQKKIQQLTAGLNIPTDLMQNKDDDAF